MKAISPMVAVILLIAFTIAIGGILSVWFSGLVRITGGPTEASAKKVAECAIARLVIEEVNATLGRIIYANPSPKLITNIKITLDGSEVNASKTTLATGEVGVNTNVSVGGNTTVVVRGLCEGEVPVEGRCSVGDICWKR
jgi:flagellin-like protein